MSSGVVPFSLKDASALIERLLPVQKLSAEAYKEQMAGSGKTLTALGSYWKGRKPLILNRACILGSLLPATANPRRDLEVFEKLMAMDDESFVIRWKRRPRPDEILARMAIARISDYFVALDNAELPASAPVDWTDPKFAAVNVLWRDDIPERVRRQIEAQLLPRVPYRQRMEDAQRPEEVSTIVHDHIWDDVNAHLNTSADSIPELVEQLGIMRFGHRPRVADAFCGSGQIAFEAARIGCDVFASDLNPIACMLTWGAFHIAGGSAQERERLESDQQELAKSVLAEIDALNVESDGAGWSAKTYLYCAEARCPQSGWMVPLLPTRVISKQRTGDRNNVIAELRPDPIAKRYEVTIKSGVTDREVEEATLGTIRREGRFGDAYLFHQVDGTDYKTSISTLRGDYQAPDGTIANRVRRWGLSDFRPRSDDIFQERLYCIQWVRPRAKGRGEEYEFRSATDDDLRRERVVEEFIASRLSDWQAKGWLPTMRIEPGGPPRYEGMSLIRGRGWTHWHHLFTPRQLLLAGLVNKASDARLKFGLTQLINWNSRLSSWNPGSGGGGSVAQTFYNQALRRCPRIC